MKKTVFVQTVCVFCLLFVFLSCEKDYIEKNSDKKVISKEDLFDGNLEFYGFNQTNGDSIGVYTIGDYGWYIHNGGRYTYTFRVTNTPEGGYLQNILFDCDENDTCYVYLFEYDLTQSERDSILAGNKVNLEGKIVNVESLSPDEVDVAARSGPCGPIFTYVDVTVSWCGCNVAAHAGGCCGCNCRRSQTTTYVYVDMSPCQGANPPLIFTMGGGGGGGAGSSSSTATSSDGNYPCLAISSESPCNGSFTTPVVVVEPPPEDCDTSKEDLMDMFPNADSEDMEKLADMINDLGAEFGIDTEVELQHFLAQAGQETGGFTDLNVTEDLDYTATRLVEVWPSRFSQTNPNKLDPDNYDHDPQALANNVYCCRMGNGNEASGDGWEYRGRGIFQLTGKNNYDAYHDFLTSKGIGWMYTSPSDLEYSTHAILSALWFFQENVLEDITIDENTTVDEVTDEVNLYTDEDSRDAREDQFTEAETYIDCL